MAGKVTTQGKKAVTAKKVAPAKITAAEKKVAPAKKTTAKRKTNKGDSFVCEVCGLSVIVDEYGDVLDAQEIICCAKPMKQSAGKAKSAKK